MMTRHQYEENLNKIQEGWKHFTAENPGDPVVTPFQMLCWADEARQGARFTPQDFLEFVEIPFPDPEDMELGTTFWASMHGDNALEHLFMVVQKHTNATPVEGVMLSCAIHGTGAHPNVVDRATIHGVTPPPSKE